MTTELKKIILILSLMILVYVLFYFFVLPKTSKYYAYSKFCAERPDFCKCSIFECNFNPRGRDFVLSEGDYRNKNLEDLCSLAKELNDKGVLRNCGIE